MVKIVSDTKAKDEDIKVIETGLREFNKRHTGLETIETRAVYIKEEDEIKGGISYICLKPFAYVKLLWISDELRGKGYGEKLLSAAEEDAKTQGSTKVMLDTFSFQAPEFYKKMGYKDVFEIDGYPVASAKRIWFIKEL